MCTFSVCVCVCERECERVGQGELTYSPYTTMYVHIFHYLLQCNQISQPYQQCMSLDELLLKTQSVSNKTLGIRLLWRIGFQIRHGLQRQSKVLARQWSLFDKHFYQEGIRHTRHLENALQIQTTQHITKTGCKYRQHNTVMLHNYTKWQRFQGDTF